MRIKGGEVASRKNKNTLADNSKMGGKPAKVRTVIYAHQEFDALGA